MTSTAAVDLITVQFLDRLADDVDAALDVVDDAIVYTNVGFPTVRGKRRFTTVMRVLNTRWTRFDYRMLNASATDDGVVLTERIDELSIGPLRLQFWVCARFEVRDGRITVWRDYFDVYDCTKALVRGVIALVFPRVLRPLHQPLAE